MKRVACLLCLAFLLGGAANAAIINVPGDYALIADAVGAAVTGDEVVIAAGVYPLASTLYVSADITITGAGSGSTVIQCPFGNMVGYGISCSADNFAFSGFTLEGAGAAGPRYGFHISGAAYADAPSGSLTDIETTLFYRTGLDMNGVDGVTITDCASHDNGGAGVAFCDGKNAVITNLTTHDNAWGGCAVYTYGQYHTPGVWGVSFAGTNSMPDAFYIEEGNSSDPANPIPISFSADALDGADVTLQLADFSYFMTGESDNDNEYHFFFPDLATAIAVAQLDPSPFHMASGAHVVGLDDAAVYFGIQGAIDAASAGDLIELAAGTFTENFDVNKHVLLVGAGSGDDPLVDTIVTQNPTGAGDTKIGVAQLSGSGASELDPIVLRSLHIVADGMAGISVGRFTEATGQNVAYVWLDDVRVTGHNVDPNTEQERGLYVDLTSNLSYLKVTGCAFDNLTYGWYLMKENSADASNVRYVTVDNTTFNHNNLKGVYAEKLSDATFTDCTISQNGFSDSGVPSYFLPWMCGVDMNMKAGSYAHLHFVDCTVTDNALGGAKEGVGLTVKGRGTGNFPSSSYTTYPAWVDDVQILGGTYTGNERGVRFGEPGKENASPTNVVVSGASLYGNVQTYVGVDGTAYGDAVNTMMPGLEVDAGGCWWGDDDPTGQTAGEVDVSPWLGFVPGTAPMTWYVTGSIQEAIDAASAGDVVDVAPGFYEERLIIAKPLTLLGATAAVNKNGYAVPPAYAWDTGVESVVSYPDPTGLDQSLSQLVNVESSEVTVKGFVFQVLNARCGYNGDNLFRVNAGIPGGAGTYIENVVVENNVLGPATNTTTQDGTCGRMNLYLASPTYPTHRQGIVNSAFRGNKIFGAEGNGDNVFIWGGAESYGSLQNADYTGTVIEDNEITGSHRSGVEIAGGVSNLTIQDNLITDNASTNGGVLDANLKYGTGIMVIRMGSDKTSASAMGVENLTITGNVITDNEKYGIYLGPFNTGHTIADNEIYGNGLDGLTVDLTEFYYGGAYPEYGVASSITAADNEIYDNGGGASVVGVPTNGFALDASGCWWGEASGPYHVSLNPTGTGNAVTDYVIFEPWLGMGGIAALPAVSGPINCAETVVLSVNFTPDALTPALRGFTITVDASAELSFDRDDIDSADPFAGLGDFLFYDEVDNGDGTITVDAAIAGPTAGLTSAATLFTVEVHPAADGPGVVDLLDVSLRDLDNGDIGASVSGASVSVDCTAPPAVTDIAAAPAHGQVDVSWVLADESDVDHYEVWRGMWYDTGPNTSAYPEYDDLLNGATPTRPADRAAAFASAEWMLAGTAPAGVQEFADEFAPRGVYYYEVFVVDAATNYGPAAAANDRSTNYYLGDVPPAVDGQVLVGDITQLGAAYGTVHGEEKYEAEIDVGPTDDRGGLGIPLTDSEIGFEDLMIFALNYDTVGKRGPVEVDPVVALAWLRVDDTTWSLELSEPCSGFQGLNLRAALPAGVAVSVTRGELLESQAAPVFLENADAEGLDLGLAVLGHGVSFAGAGELLRVSVAGADEVRPVLTARGCDNSELETALKSGAIDLPTAVALKQNHPNPFNPSTTIAFALPADGKVRLAVYGLDGSLVRTLVSESMDAGRHEAVWDGRDDAGRQVASGAYFYRLEAAGTSLTHKMLLMK